ncbi:MAG: hypothetical protein U1F43_21255 [Myxococcota bacterium]
MGHERSASRAKGAKSGHGERRSQSPQTKEQGGERGGQKQRETSSEAMADPAGAAREAQGGGAGALTGKMQQSGGNAATHDALNAAPTPTVAKPKADGMEATLARYADEIVAMLMDGALSPAQQWRVVAIVESVLSAQRAGEADLAGQGMDGAQASPLLDTLLAKLERRHFVRKEMGSEIHGLVLDELHHRLQGGALDRLRAAMAESRRYAAWNPTDEGAAGGRESAFQAVVTPVLWKASQLGTLGIVDQDIVAKLDAASKRGHAQGGSVFQETMDVLVPDIGMKVFNILTLGMGPAAYDAGAAYAKAHPGCAWRDVMYAGEVAALKAVLPIEEVKTVAKALKMIPPDAHEVPPDFATGLQAASEGLLKLALVFGAVSAGAKAMRSEPVKGASGEAGKGDAGRGGTASRQPAPGDARVTETTPKPADGTPAPAETTPVKPGEATPASQRLQEIRALPRAEILERVRRATGMGKELAFWEGVGPNEIVEGVRAGPLAAERLGVPEGTIIGYKVTVKGPTGGAIADAANVETRVAPYRDPFAPSAEAASAPSSVVSIKKLPTGAK